MTALIDQMRAHRSDLIRAFLAALLVLAGLAALLAGATLTLLEVPAVRDRLAARLSAELAADQDMSVRIGDIDGSWPSRLILRDVEIADREDAWALVPEITLDIRPAALWRGELHIPALTIPSAQIQRRPVSDETGASDPFEIPVLPVDLRIETIDIRKVALAAPVSGQELEAELSGRLIWTGGSIDAELHAHALGEAPSRIDGHLLLDRQAKTLDLAVEMRDGTASAKGLVATLIDWPRNEPLHLKVEGGSEAEKIRIEMTLNAQDRPVIHLEADGSWTDDLRLAIDFRAEPHLVPLWQSESPATLQGSANLAWTADDRLEIAEGKLAYDTARLQIALSIENVSDDAAHAWQSAGQIEGWQSLLAQPVPAPLSAPVHWSGQGEVTGRETISGALDLTWLNESLTASLQGTLALSAPAFDGRAEIRLPHLADWRDLGDGLDGAVTVKLDALAYEEASGLQAVLAADWQQPGTGQAELDRLLSSGVTLNANLRLDAQRTLHVEAMQAAPGDRAVMVRGSGRASEERLAVDLTAEIPDAAKIDAGIDIAGALTAELTLDGAWHGPAAQLNLDWQKGSLGGQRFQAMRLSANLPDGRAGQFEASLTGRPAPLSLNGEIARQADGLRLQNLTGSLFGGSLTGEADLAADWKVDLSEEGASLAAIGALAELDLAGRADYRIVGGKATSNGRVELQLTSERMGSGEDIELDNLRLDGAYAIAADTLHMELTARGGRIATTQLNTLRLTADGPLDRLTLDADAAGAGFDSERPVTLNARALYRPDRIEVAQIDLRISDTHVALDEPVTLRRRGTIWRGEGWRLRTMAADAGTLGGSLTLSPASLNLQVTADTFPLDPLVLMLPVSRIGGTVTGNLTYARAEQRGKMRLDFSSISVEQRLSPPVAPFNARIIADLSGRALDLNLHTAGVSTKPLSASLKLPVSYSSGNAWPDFNRRGTIGGAIDWQGPIESAMALVDLPLHRLTGKVAMGLQISGTLDRPRWDGTIDLQAGTYENYETGTRLGNLSLQAQGRGTSALQVTARATDTEQGSISLSGAITLAPLWQPQLDLRVELDKAVLVRRDEAVVAASGSVHLTGSLAAQTDSPALQLSGALIADQAQFRIPERLPVQIVEIEVDKVINGAAAPAAQSTERATDLAVGLDLQISNAAPIAIDGRGLQSLWEGKLDVSGTSAKPRIQGTLQTLRGTFEFAGKLFELSRGRIEFDGTDEIDPSITLIATYRGDEFTGRIQASGRASNVDISLSSTPSLPEDEILSRILFGKSAGTLTPVEALQLANSLATLTGRGGASGAGLLSRVQRTLGLDVLRVGGEAADNVGVTAGQYLSEDIYVGITQGLGGAETSVTVEIEVTDDITVDTEIGPQSGSDVGVNWKWDY